MLVVLWSKLNKAAILVGPLAGSSLGLMAWLVTCRFYYGSLTTTNLAASYSSLAGSMVSLGMGALLSVFISLAKPDSYDFSGTRGSTFILPVSQ